MRTYFEFVQIAVLNCLHQMNYYSIQMSWCLLQMNSNLIQNPDYRNLHFQMRMPLNPKGHAHSDLLCWNFDRSCYLVIGTDFPQGNFARQISCTISPIDSFYSLKFIEENIKHIKLPLGYSNWYNYLKFQFQDNDFLTVPSNLHYHYLSSVVYFVDTFVYCWMYFVYYCWNLDFH